MSTVLQLTDTDGAVHEVPFNTASTITVRTRVQGVSGVELQEFAVTSVASIEIIDTTTGETLAAIDDTTPGFESVASAIHVAKGMALADAGAHIEKAIVKFGPDEGLLQVQADLNKAAAAGDETWTTDVEPDFGSDDPEAEAAQKAAAEAEQEIVDALAAIEACETVDDVIPLVDAAVEKWPEDERVVAVKSRVDEIVAERDRAAAAAAEAEAAKKTETK